MFRHIYNEEYRLCLFCDENIIENEEGFVLHYNFYNQLREKQDEQFKILISEHLVKDIAEFLYSSYTKRRKGIYN